MQKKVEWKRERKRERESNREEIYTQILFIKLINKHLK
jgi:hypothetical protein